MKNFLTEESTILWILKRSAGLKGFKRGQNTHDSPKEYKALLERYSQGTIQERQYLENRHNSPSLRKKIIDRHLNEITQIIIIIIHDQSSQKAFNRRNSTNTDSPCLFPQFFRHLGFHTQVCLIVQCSRVPDTLVAGSRIITGFSIWTWSLPFRSLNSHAVEKST